MTRTRETCAACGKPSAGNYSIHRDGFGEGPEVPLCDACGGRPEPTCDELWASIRRRRARATTAAPIAVLPPSAPDYHADAASAVGEVLS